MLRVLSPQLREQYQHTTGSRPEPRHWGQGGSVGIPAQPGHSAWYTPVPWQRPQGGWGPYSVVGRAFDAGLGFGEPLHFGPERIHGLLERSAVGGGLGLEGAAVGVDSGESALTGQRVGLMRG